MNFSLLISEERLQNLAHKYFHFPLLMNETGSYLTFYITPKITLVFHTEEGLIHSLAWFALAEYALNRTSFLRFSGIPRAGLLHFHRCFSDSSNNHSENTLTKAGDGLLAIEQKFKLQFPNFFQFSNNFSHSAMFLHNGSTLQQRHNYTFQFVFPAIKEI